MHARQIMTREVICVNTETPLFEAQRLMEIHKVRHLPVLQSTQLIGILSDRDLLRAERDIAAGRRPENGPIGTAMTPIPVTATAGATISHLAGLMIEWRIDSVPIVDLRGDLVGLVTSTDLLELLRDDEQHGKVIPFQFEMRHAGRRAVM